MSSALARKDFATFIYFSKRNVELFLQKWLKSNKIINPANKTNPLKKVFESANRGSDYKWNQILIVWFAHVKKNQ